MCCNILCKSMTGGMCGDSVPDVATSMYSMVCVRNCSDVVERIMKVSKH